MFLCAGDALFDLFAEEGEDVAAVALSGRIGGSTLNVALGLARLGHRVGFFTKLSRDLFGQRLGAFMERENIDRRLLVETDRNTTLAIVALAADGTPNYAFHLDADVSVTSADLPATLGDEIEAIHVSSYSTVVQPAATALAELLRREKDRRFISYDPNIRASVEPELDLWRAKVAEVVPMAGLVKASEEDLQTLAPGRDCEAVIADWLAAGAALAIVTRGEKGAIAGTAGGVDLLRVPGIETRVVDTVGAGDTFQAAMLAGLKEAGHLSRDGVRAAGEARIRAVVEFAVRAAAVTCSRRGANLPTRADLSLPPLG